MFSIGLNIDFFESLIVCFLNNNQSLVTVRLMLTAKSITDGLVRYLSLTQLRAARLYMLTQWHV